ncbi:MAG: trigger factor [Bdellovibrionaceae bacterium]|nr:trigger factor [Pseudobdellovibrionaceae bacterium]NUM57655.1 trigger factor [Pseudobdellovibrionaceae bacterium]
MKSNVEKLSSLQRKLNVEVPSTTVQSSYERIFNDIQKEVTIKGFRKGKAPLSAIKSMYNSKVKQDVVQDLIQMHYVKALVEHKLDPISYPEFEFDDLSEEKNFSFSATFDIRPEISLKKYENLSVEKEILKFDDAQVDKVVENLRNSKATYEDLATTRPAQLGDLSVIDFEGFVDGQPLEGGSGKDHRLELGSKQFIEGFEEGIVGMNIGEEKTLKLSFPTPYHSKDLEGKAVEFKVKLTGIKTKQLPELNDEFIKAANTGVNSVEEFKKVVKQDLEASDKKRVEDAFKNRLLKTLVKENPVDVPSSLLKDQKLALIEDFKKRMAQQGMDDVSLKEYIEKWDKDFEKTATEMIQSSFLVDAIGKKYDLICKQEDVDKKFQEYAAQTGIDESRIREFYSKEETMSRLTYQITEEKVISKLMETVKIKEVTKEQLKEEEN